MPRRYTAHRQPARPSMPRPAGPRAAYPSDLTDPQWALIEPFMPPETRAGGREPTFTRSSTPSSTCSTRAATGSPCPTTSPHPARSVITLARWCRDGTLQRLHDALRDQARIAAERDLSPPPP